MLFFFYIKFFTFFRWVTTIFSSTSHSLISTFFYFSLIFRFINYFFRTPIFTFLALIFLRSRLPLDLFIFIYGDISDPSFYWKATYFNSFLFAFSSLWWRLQNFCWKYLEQFSWLLSNLASSTWIKPRLPTNERFFCLLLWLMWLFLIMSSFWILDSPFIIIVHDILPM